MHVGSAVFIANARFPRYFTFFGCSVSAYKFFLCVGIYAGTLATAAWASASGLSPLRVGLAAMACALVGMVGARLYHLMVYAPIYIRQRSVSALWDTKAGGFSVFGAFFTFVPASFVAAAWLGIPVAVLWDQMAIGVLVGGILGQTWMRIQRLLCRAGVKCASQHMPSRHAWRYKAALAGAVSGNGVVARWPGRVVDDWAWCDAAWQLRFGCPGLVWSWQVLSGAAP